MPLAVTIDCIDVLITPDVAQHQSFFAQHLDALKQANRDVDAVIMASSSDLTFLACGHSQACLLEIFEAFPEAQHDIITQGCLGLYASVLHFIQDTKIQSALVVMLETPYESLQGGLNASSLGRAFGQDGMLANPGVGICRLQKKEAGQVAEDDLVIDVSEIIAKGRGLNGNAIFLKRIIDRVHELHRDIPAKMVSFEIKADLSMLFMKFLQPELNRLGLGACWLPSIEQDALHVFSLKPLMEIQRYKAHLEHSPLIAFGLGAGGRLGVLRVSRGARYKEKLSAVSLNTAEITGVWPGQMPVTIEQPLLELYQQTIAAIEAVATEEAYYQRGKDMMLTLNKSYLGIDNLYFRFAFSIEQLKSLRPARNPAMQTIVPAQRESLPVVELALAD